MFSQKDKTSFGPDGVVVVQPEFGRKLDCKYVWVERVLTRGLSKEKRFWLPKKLSSEWLIVLHGKPEWKPGWQAIRPETYTQGNLQKPNSRAEPTISFKSSNGDDHGTTKIDLIL
ncbi:MAG: hypothetical protein OEY31_06200 [Candidatus Bathyarchaeota archaeon]|nr:hypothetical protein [Candidatus Bathyarchaeota archaeon]